MKIIKPFIFAYFLLLTHVSFSQNLFHNNLYTISNDKYRLIFFKGFHRQTVSIGNFLYSVHNSIVGNKLSVDRLPIFINNYSCTSNSAFTSPPTKITFSMFSTQDYLFIGSAEWIILTAIHEYRHNIQNQLFKSQGLSKLIYSLFGVSLASCLIPNWLFEGDAVGFETILTKSGRGRSPMFGQLYRIHLLENGRLNCYDYMYGANPLNNRYKLPNRYTLGYYMSTYLKRKYGNDIIDNILITSGKYLLPFELALKIETGKILSKKRYSNVFYNFLNKYRKTTPLFDIFLNLNDGVWMDKVFYDANKEIYDIYRKQLYGLEVSDVELIYNRNNKREFVNYVYPYCGPDGSIIAMKYGVSYVNEFIYINNDVEKKILKPSSIENGKLFSYSNNVLAWAQTIRHPIKSDIEYSVINTYDLVNKKLNRLTKNTRYRAPCISPDGKRIAVVESDKDDNHNITIISSSNGRVLKKFSNHDNSFYFTPRWSTDGSFLIAVKSKDQKHILVTINLSTKAINEVGIPSNIYIGNPVAYKNYIFYTSCYDGINNIYVLDLDSKQVYKVTFRKYGAYNPCVSKSGEWIYFNDFTIFGRQIVRIPFDPKTWKEIGCIKDRSVYYYEPMIINSHKPNLTDIKFNRKPKRYYPINHVETVSELDFSKPFSYLGFIIKSSDILDTLIFNFHYQFKHTDNEHVCCINLKTKEIFPNMGLVTRIEKKKL